MYASIVEEIKKKEKFIVLSPDIQASELLKRILFIIHENQREIDLQIGFSEHPAYYITVDRIFDLLASISEATGHEKLKKNINKALLEFIEKREEDKYNWGYIYPVLHLENALIKANICLISPQNDVRIPIAPIRKNCFEYSKNILDIILKGSVKNNKYDYNIHPVEKIYNEEIKKIIPYGLSIEHEINSLINSAFKPFSFIPIQDYIEDVIEYGNDKGYLIEITNDYHFRKSDILLDEYGNYIQSPPLYWHFFTILKGMESFVLDELNFLAR
ncbi:MAG: hypothetical protein KDK36_20270, partial [Leptospiraceae bacterium]|nr:hypothetical protein [Leptospiraceae bacterium]